MANERKPDSQSRTSTPLKPRPNEFTLDENWKNIGVTLGTNAIAGAVVGSLLSLVLLRRGRPVFIGFSSGVGVGIGWRDSHASSQFVKFSNQTFTGQTLPTLKDRFMQMTSDLISKTKDKS
mmetsp:Transcript_16138/g.24768  ORF Transcript_16138/g.24768 Transcript_16138/m.24768 type:complete len:121 (-) Transcript_16138:230-592(-)|eukprot:CAMPEP_0202729920 /NCGR_PEP_ID=MMETSP1385-20130828/186379_1 /ASSEMBLY_ACC=CAM_ASM_000861 /TAXON_ID=933848 /ORGANISM="Elphidium margaritaceum" /LENGTH=120 /DNA_ID=CAMNT_0049396191 /DNA_START=33 /DNA_END=395 /DNA_ORIENTATION=+